MNGTTKNSPIALFLSFSCLLDIDTVNCQRRYGTMDIHSVPQIVSRRAIQCPRLVLHECHPDVVLYHVVVVSP